VEMRSVSLLSHHRNQRKRSEREMRQGHHNLPHKKNTKKNKGVIKPSPHHKKTNYKTKPETNK